MDHKTAKLIADLIAMNVRHDHATLVRAHRLIGDKEAMEAIRQALETLMTTGRKDGSRGHRAQRDTIDPRRGRSADKELQKELDLLSITDEDRASVVNPIMIAARQRPALVWRVLQVEEATDQSGKKRPVRHTTKEIYGLIKLLDTNQLKEVRQRLDERSELSTSLERWAKVIVKNGS